MVKVFKKIICLIAIIFFLNFISASFTNGNLSYSIDKIYAPSGVISGWVNISLINEPTNAIFKSSVESLEKKINLIDLIRKNSNLGFSYACSPLDCSSDYSTIGTGASSKSAVLNSGESSIFGFKITSLKPVVSVDSFSLKLTSDNAETNTLPLAVDFLNDGSIEWKSNIASDNFNDVQYGCYLDSASNSLADLASIPYCEKITLSEAPAVNISAKVVGTATDIPFTMSIEDTGGTSKKTCSVLSSGNGEIGCVPSNFYVNGGDYFVCVKPTNPAVDARKYKIAYEQNSPCGFSGIYSGSYSEDFNIFAKTKKYGPIGTTTFNSATITKEIKDYLSVRYGNDCTKGCIIPIKFMSGIANQKIDLTEPSLAYTAEISATETNMYNFTEMPAKINAPFQKLNLNEIGFSVPANLGNYTYYASLDDINLFSERIRVESAPIIQYVTPLKTAITYPTKFVVGINSTKNISSYRWSFGDGNNATTKTKEVVYAYSTVGDYELTVSAVDAQNRSSSKTFIVKVSPASEIVPVLLQDMSDNIDNLKIQILGFSAFEQKSVNALLKLDDSKKMVLDLQSSISGTTTESDYEAMLGKILNMSIPKLLVKTASSSDLIYYPQKENIDLNSLTQITQENYDIANEDAYRNAILVWDDENLDTKITYSETSAIYDDYEAPLLKTFDMTFTKKDSNSPYLVIKDMNNLLFDQDYSLTSGDGYKYTRLNDQGTHIIFSTTDDVDFITLPLFVSPKISDLSLNGNIPSFQKGLNKWIIFAIIAVIIIVVWLIVWVLIKLWYKRKYENYLFKNRNNLYNLLNYIDGEKKKGLKEREIASKLRKAGWNYEQVSYALKKYSGKKIV
ncbi:PKD domain protein [uncultured archaeon]|nr:PKD domain protein [uncultured archaeon]